MSLVSLTSRWLDQLSKNYYFNNFSKRLIKNYLKPIVQKVVDKCEIYLIMIFRQLSTCSSFLQIFKLGSMFVTI